MIKSNTLVGYAVTAAITAVTSAVHATDITTYAQHESAGLNVNVYISGSTAIDNTINAELTATYPVPFHICQPGTVTEYQEPDRVLDVHGNPIGGAIETLWYCQADTASGASTYLYLAIFKESTAGSINGIQPLITVAKGGQSGLTFLNPTGPDVQNGTCANLNNNNDMCTDADFSQNVVPTGGVSDVEAPMLRTIPGAGTLSGDEVSYYLVSAPGLDVVWGLAVTKNLYYALQTAEGLTSKCPLASNGATNFDSPACAPSLSKEQVAGLLDRDIVSWKSLGLDNPSGDNTVYICRGGVGSGAEAAFEAYFLGARCGTSSEQMASQDGSTVFEQASTANITRCLRAFVQGGFQVNITPYNQDFGTSYRAFTPAGNQWAIGITSTEITPSELTRWGDTLRMVAIDGVLPTLENVVNGYDPFWTTDSWYNLKPGETGDPTLEAGDVFAAMRQPIGQPLPTLVVDQNYADNPWGDGGDLSPAWEWATSTTYASYPVTHTELLNNPGDPVNLWSKALSGSVDNCDTPVLWKGAAGLVSPAESTLQGTGNVNQGP